MKTLSLKWPRHVVFNNRIENYGLFGLLLLLWFTIPLTFTDPLVGVIDPNIWLLIVLGMICFLGLVGLCWWLLQRFWITFRLPGLNGLAFHFKSMEKWQQVSFYFASFALLLLAAVGCLVAIC